MHAEALDHARCSENCALIILKLMIWDFDVFLQNRKAITMKSSNTDNFAYLGALGVLKTTPACFVHHIWYGKPRVQCIFNGACTYLIIVSSLRFIFPIWNWFPTLGRAPPSTFELPQVGNQLWIDFQLISYFGRSTWVAVGDDFNNSRCCLHHFEGASFGHGVSPNHKTRKMSTTIRNISNVSNMSNYIK